MRRIVGIALIALTMARCRVRNMRGRACERCLGYCTDGAECAVSRYVGKRYDWRRRPLEEVSG